MRFRVALLALLLSAGVAVGDPGGWHGGPSRPDLALTLPTTLNTTLLPPMAGQAMSLVFDGLYELVAISADTVGFVSTFSYAIWAKNEAAPAISSDGLIAVRQSGSAQNIFSFGFANASDVHIVMSIANNTPSTRQFRQWSNAIADDNWHFYVITWDGAGSVDSLELYVDSVNLTVDLGGIDSDDTGIIDSSRLVVVGGTSTGAARFNGPVYYAAIWSTELLQAEIDSIYNGGAPITTDLQTAFGSYTSAGSLLHWYRVGLGTTEAEFGTDHVGTLDLETAVRVLDETDLTTDIPQ